MDINENGVLSLSSEQLESLIGTDLKLKNQKVLVSTECIQDMFLYRKNLFSIKCKRDFTNEEIEGYLDCDKKLSFFNFEKSKKKIDKWYR